ncbi:MAG: hypothetical protein OWS74_04430 [Firmicutes bacterium]|nr:hypothetical protein [Bacillota bacterium]
MKRTVWAGLGIVAAIALGSAAWLAKTSASTNVMHPSTSLATSSQTASTVSQSGTSQSALTAPLGTTAWQQEGNKVMAQHFSLASGSYNWVVPLSLSLNQIYGVNESALHSDHRSLWIVPGVQMSGVDFAIYNSKLPASGHAQWQFWHLSWPTTAAEYVWPTPVGESLSLTSLLMPGGNRSWLHFIFRGPASQLAAFSALPQGSLSWQGVTASAPAPDEIAITVVASSAVSGPQAYTFTYAEDGYKGHDVGLEWIGFSAASTLPALAPHGPVPWPAS